MLMTQCEYILNQPKVISILLGIVLIDNYIQFNHTDVSHIVTISDVICLSEVGVPQGESFLLKFQLLITMTLSMLCTRI